MPKTVVTDKLTAGVSRSVVILKDIVKSNPIQVFIRGYGTTKNQVFSIAIPTDFTGERCLRLGERFLVHRAQIANKIVISKCWTKYVRRGAES